MVEDYDWDSRSELPDPCATSDMSLTMHMLARRQGRNLQSLMAEAFNDALRKYSEGLIED